MSLCPCSIFHLSTGNTSAWNTHIDISHSMLQAIMGLRESSWDTFYGLLSQHIKEYLPIIYTP